MHTNVMLIMGCLNSGDDNDDSRVITNENFNKWFNFQVKESKASLDTRVHLWLGENTTKVSEVIYNLQENQKSVNINIYIYIH